MAKSVLDIVIKTIKEGGGDKETVKGLVALKGQLTSMAGAGGLVTGVLTGMFAVLQRASSAAEESARTHAKLEAVLASTGSAAGLSVGQLDDMADALSRITGVDDDLITNAEAVMLTFTKIGSDVFPVAIKAALDMSAVLDGDLKQATIATSKALNDFSGYTALKRSGVSFSEEQIKQIENFKKTNDLAGYQNLVLAELAIEFSGTASAMHKAGGATNVLKNAWGNLIEAFGQSQNISWFNDFKIGVAYTLDGITDLINASGSGEQAFTAYAHSIGMTGPELDALGKGMNRFNAEMERGKAMTAFYSGGLKENVQALEEDAQALEEDAQAAKEASAAHQSMLGLITNIASETRNYNEKQAELTQKMAENRAEAEALYPWQKTQLDELNSKYADMSATYDANAAAHNAAMGKIQYDLLVTKLSADGLTDAEYQMAQQAGLMFGVFDQSSVNTANNMNLVTQAVTDGRLSVEDMGKALDMLPTMKSIDVVINALVHTASDLVTGHEQGQGMQGGYAAGGISTGPASGHMELLHGTEAVIPLQNGSIPVQMQGVPAMSGGNTNINVQLTIASPMTILDQQTAQNTLLPFIINGVREAKSRGAL